MATTDEVINKYRNIIERQLGEEDRRSSKDYKSFKADMVQEIHPYERLAKTLGNIVSMKVAEKDRAKIQKQLDIAHVDVTAAQALTLALFGMLVTFFANILICVSIYLITGVVQGNLLLFGFLGLMASMFVFYYAYSMPARLANEWRLKASAQMVPAILYMVVYMKHTSNLERAVEFAGDHLEGPLALDFKKIFYNVEVGKYTTIKQAIDNYLESWREYAPEFVESFHLIESSLYEPSESRRVNILEKALQVILDGIYEKMLKYSRSIRTPLTNVYMLGIILPTLGLALLPLASTLLGGLIQWTHVFVIFNLIVPLLVFYMASEVLLKRPGGYGESSILELNPDYAKYKSNTPWIASTIIAIPLLIIGLLPFLLQSSFITSTLGIPSDTTFSNLGISLFGNIKLFDFKVLDGQTTGPFGPGAMILSLCIPLAIGIFFSMAYKQKTRELIKSREETKMLEEEFTNSLFQLGNRLGDGVPAEIAFSKVAESTQGQKTHDFFSLVGQNIQGSGMSLDKAIFDPRRGAIIYYPSALISTSMRILVESVKKGLAVAARSLMSISEYVKNIQKINQRLKDLLAEIVSDMRSNMTFLAPLLAGIVVGLSTMITSILNKLQDLQASGSSTASIAGLGSLGNITSIFNVTQMIPPYFMQVSIGVYIIEIIFILTKTLVTIDAGKDTLKEKYEISRNLTIGLTLYLITAFISITALTLLSSLALGSLGS
jgi:Flp pilus assembly protein TadB